MGAKTVSKPMDYKEIMDGYNTRQSDRQMEILVTDTRVCKLSYQTGG
jgi:hypothetical protein